MVSRFVGDSSTALAAVPAPASTGLSGTDGNLCVKISTARTACRFRHCRSPIFPLVITKTFQSVQVRTGLSLMSRKDRRPGNLHYCSDGKSLGNLVAAAGRHSPQAPPTVCHHIFQDDIAPLTRLNNSCNRDLSRIVPTPLLWSLISKPEVEANARNTFLIIHHRR